jgi:ubiquinone/menaquinone biosynthesis C-methylase UbiE
MSRPTESSREHPSAYFVQDRSNQEEIARLEIQDTMLTTGMGGVLPEQADPTALRRVLDVGCGTGGWLREMARHYPQIETVVGADISTTMLKYAKARTEESELQGRVQFRMMDALRTLEFPPARFDLVNQRAGLSWLRTWEWSKCLLEYERVTLPGGVIRITECDVTVESKSPALTKLWDIALTAAHHSGRLFTAKSDGVTGELVRLMTQHRIEDVQTRVYHLVYPAGTEAGQCFSEDMLHLFRVGLPYLQKWTRLPDDYQNIYQQALKEMQQPDFVATWRWVTAWGNKSLYGEPLQMGGLR